MKKLLGQLKWLFEKSKPIKGLLLINTCINMILSGISIALALFSKSLIDAASTANLPLVLRWIKVLALVFAIQLFLRAFVKYQHTYVITRLLNDIQRQYFKHLLHSRWQYQKSYHSMNLLGRISNDAAKVTTLICDTFPSLLILSLTFLISFITLLKLEPKIALITLIVAPLFALPSLCIRKNMRQLYHKTQDQEIKYNTYMQENLQNIIIVKSFCHEQKSMKAFDELQDKRLILNLRTCKLTIKADLLLSIGSTLTYFLIFSITTYELACHQMSFGTLAALLQLYRNVQTPLSNLAGSIAAIIQGIVSVERLMEIEAMPEENLALTHENKGLEASLGLIDMASFQSLRLKNVKFAYEEGKPVLKNINLEIKAGEIIGLIGPSGCGKTTLIRLLLGIITPSQGEITCQVAQQITALTTICRHFMSYVPQGNTLFSGTIEENITYGQDSTSFEEIKKAAVLAAAWPFIENLKEGLNTRIGEKNKGLSEGQAQRLTIARALLCKKPILILDEATSALDSSTEMEILNNLKTLENHPACIIITHRQAALQICSHIYKLIDGQLLEN